MTDCFALIVFVVFFLGMLLLSGGFVYVMMAASLTITRERVGEVSQTTIKIVWTPPEGPL